MAVNQLDIKDRLLSAIQNNSIHKHPKINKELFQKENIQQKLSPLLREIAIQHLKLATTATAKSFRGEHLLINSTEHEKYLQTQAKDMARGTEIEANALGEALQINIVVTSVYKNRSDATWCLHLETEDSPTIHLYNYENIHWANNVNLLTKGDGNCLFYAIAQALHELTFPPIQKTPLNSNSIFKYGSLEKDTIIRQSRINQAIISAVKNQQTLANKEISYLEEEKRISKLPDAEKEQIAKDYAYALKLAREIMLSTKIDNYNEPAATNSPTLA